LNAGKSIKVAFEEFAGPDDFENSIMFMEQKFKDVKDPITGNKKLIHAHVTCATETDNIRKTFNEIRDYLIKELTSPRLM